MALILLGVTALFAEPFAAPKAAAALLALESGEQRAGGRAGGDPPVGASVELPDATLCGAEQSYRAGRRAPFWRIG